MSTDIPQPPGDSVPVPRGDHIPVPRGDYVPATVHNGVAYTAGMTPRIDGRLTVAGVVGDSLTAAQAREAAGVAAGNALAAARAALPPGAVRCLKMTVFVACSPDFHDLSDVADGASAVIRAELGDSLPARSAIGVQCLPSGAPVEVELVCAAG